MEHGGWGDQWKDEHAKARHSEASCGRRTAAHTVNRPKGSASSSRRRRTRMCLGRRIRAAATNCPASIPRRPRMVSCIAGAKGVDRGTLSTYLRAQLSQPQIPATICCDCAGMRSENCTSDSHCVRALPFEAEPAALHKRRLSPAGAIKGHDPPSLLDRPSPSNRLVGQWRSLTWTVAAQHSILASGTWTAVAAAARPR
jgi:hypothetical protein